MTEKEFPKESERAVETIEKKIQYGENEYFCFACGEKIELDRHPKFINRLMNKALSMASEIVKNT